MDGLAEERRDASVFLGVDTHSEAHVAVALDGAGRRLGELAVTNDRAGYTRLWHWASGFGILTAAGVEGTGSYGAGLSRFLRARGASVLEVNRTSRQHRRRHGKHDAGDAEAAARQVLSGTASGEPKGADGAAESLRALRVARRSGVKAKTQAANQLHALLSTAPDGLREGLRGLPTKHLAAKASRFRCGAGLVDPAAATKLAMRSVARRYRALSEEIAGLDAHIEPLVEEAAPELVALDGVGPDSAAALLVAAGDNPERLKSPRPPSPTFAGPRQCGPPRGRSCVIASTPAATATPIAPCTWWPSTDCGATSEPRPTSPGVPQRVSPRRRRCSA